MSCGSVISRIFGYISGVKFPKYMQNQINKWYIKQFKLDMSEFWSASSYESLNALFTRSFIKPREFDTDKNTFISPCDGTCLSYGISFGDSAFSVKGMEYRLSELLGGAMSEYEMNAGYDFVNIYLSPRDYHHYHAPFDMRIKRAIYIPGKLYSVAVKWLKKVDSLYTKNERVVLECEINGAKIWLVFVGALNVGKMRFSFDERIKTNAKANMSRVYEYDDLVVKKGDRLGNFELGSTIIIVNEKGMINYDLGEEKLVKYGKTIGTINAK